jgi:hypothetical protein
MAYKMNLSYPQEGLSFIWNISQPVGVEAEQPNLQDDVELIQRLFVESIKIGGSHSPRARGIGMPSSTSGQMDLATGFEIFWIGDQKIPHKETFQISPARHGSLMYGARYWTIAFLNVKLHSLSASTWENLPDLCSPMLKTALLTKTWP